MCVYAKEGKEKRDRKRKHGGEDRYREAQRIRGKKGEKVDEEKKRAEWGRNGRRRVAARRMFTIL